MEKEESQDSVNSTYRISGLFTYPIKSLGGISLSKTLVNPQGLDLDRRYMITDANGKFLTRRAYPQFSFLEVDFSDEKIKVTNRKKENESFHFFLEVQNRKIEVDIWGNSVQAWTVSDEADTFFSDFLGFNAHLVKMGEGSIRSVKDPNYLDHQTGFADGYPVLVISEASLRDLNARLDVPIPMDRFRPNVVVEGCRAFEEDENRFLESQFVKLKMVKPCSRCIMVNVDSQNAVVGKEPLQTLSVYRNQNHKVNFGQNAIVIEPGGLELGEEIHFA